jgi:hypothetical protein
MVLRPHLDGGLVHEHVHEHTLEGVANREHLVVDGDDAIGGHAAEDPLASVILTDVDSDGRLVLGERP